MELQNKANMLCFEEVKRDQRRSVTNLLSRTHVGFSGNRVMVLFQQIQLDWDGAMRTAAYRAAVVGLTASVVWDRDRDVKREYELFRCVEPLSDWM